MLELMRETKEKIAQTGLERWLAEAINFMEATPSASPHELSDVRIDQIAVNQCSSVSSVYS